MVRSSSSIIGASLVRTRSSGAGLARTLSVQRVGTAYKMAAGVFQYPLQVLDRALAAAKLMLTYEGMRAGADAFRDLLKTIRRAADAGADTAHEAKEAVRYAAWATAANAVGNHIMHVTGTIWGGSGAGVLSLT